MQKGELMSDEKTAQLAKIKEEFAGLNLVEIVNKKAAIVKEIKEKLIPQLSAVEKKSERQKNKKTVEKIGLNMDILSILDELQDEKDQ